MTAEELLARSRDQRLTVWQRALARAQYEAELFRQEQLLAARGEDHEQPWRELMYLYGRTDSPYRRD